MEPIAEVPEPTKRPTCKPPPTTPTQPPPQEEEDDKLAAKGNMLYNSISAVTKLKVSVLFRQK